MSGTAVRQQFVREFRELRPNTRAAAWITVTGYLLQTLIAMAIGYWLLQAAPSALTGICLGVLVLFIGTRLRGLNNIVHECCHFAFCQHREDNVLLGSICASAILGCFHDYRDEHMTHHVHLGDYEKDLDLQGIRDLRIEEPLTPRVLLRHCVTIAICRHLPYYFRINLSSRDGKVFGGIKIGLMALAFLLLILDPLAAVLLVWLPFVWVFTSINYLTDCVDHGGLIDGDDELECSRNVPLSRLLRSLVFPRNDCFHLIHHLFPQVPVRHFDLCHARLLSHPEYRVRMEAATFGRAAKPTFEPKRVEGAWASDGNSLHS